MKTRKIIKRHNFVLVKGQRRLDVGKYSFSVRITNEWNKLSTDCVYTNSVNMFKNRIGKLSVMGRLQCSPATAKDGEVIQMLSICQERLVYSHLKCFLNGNLAK